MRLEGQSKLGYYPTPENSLNLILTWLRISTEEGLRRYLDPCCGKGEVLAAIAAAHGPAETFGIELSDVRAKDAERTLNHVINTAYEYAVLTDETFSLVLLNPPYDGENSTGGGRRMEETFLLDSTPRLAPGGALIYIIPHQRINEKVARHLAGWYDDLRCFKLAGDDYEAFGQVVIFGARRQGYAPASGDDLRAVQAWAEVRIITGYEEVESEVAQPEGRPGLRYGSLPAMRKSRARKHSRKAKSLERKRFDSRSMMTCLN
jgi:predicted RNA methylase